METEYLMHFGVGHDDNPPGRGSGRWAYGTGENPGQHQFNFISEVDDMKKKGFTDREIAETLLGPKKTSTDLRAELSIAKSELKQIKISQGWEMLEKCDGNMSEAARRLGMKNESSLRSLLNPALEERRDRYQNTADMLKKVIDEKGVVDVGKGAELYLGVPRTTLDTAMVILEKDGYLKSWVKIPQATTTHETVLKVMAKPGTTHADIQKNKNEYGYIQSIDTFTPDAGKTWWTPEFPTSIDSKRVKVRYAEEGGTNKDGTIELRRGVEDISLGGSQYAQVRIAVDGTHYMKGMAIYSDGKDMPDGVDIIFNTNKHQGTPMIGEKDHEVLKRMKVDKATGEIDRTNPFGALIKSPKEGDDGKIKAGGQRHYIDADGNEKLSPINKIREEGEWDTWSRTLSSQFLAKQPIKLINQQIDISIADKKLELEKIEKLTNPVIRKKMLMEYADNCDANASDLSVKGFRNQAYQVILPVPDMKDGECYAPNYDDGETLALIRFPHGGTFEIPIVKNNTRNASAKSIMKNAHDAVGINYKTADQLSGADFDGDTVIAIPIKSNNLAIKSRPKLFENYDPKEIYKLPDDAPWMTNDMKQTQMGIVSNLITDMTVGGADFDDIAKAVKHSMVVIDAEKHHLDYKRSEKDNDIRNLKKTYQGTNRLGQPKGASTVLSRAGAEAHVPERKEITDTYKMTPAELERWNQGKKVYHNTGATKRKLITDPEKMTDDERKIYESGKKVYRMTNELKTMKVSQMDTVDDAMDLVKDKNNAKEVAYANYANQLKRLGEQARREARAIKPIPVSPTARETYAAEVDSLLRKLRDAKLNDPKERQAQTLANAMSSQKFASNPDMDYEHRKRQQARDIAEARAIVGAKKDRIVINDREWEAIQANAISASRLADILANTDQEAFKKRATPKNESWDLSNTQIAYIKTLAESGMYSQKEIADAVGASASTVSSILRDVA